MAVQRQIAASRSTRPWSREQQGRVGGEPTTTFTKPSTLAQTPSFSASLGQVPLEAGVGVGVGFGLGVGVGFGLGVGLLHGQGFVLAVTRVKKRRLRARKRAADAELFDAISTTLYVGLVILRFALGGGYL